MTAKYVLPQPVRWKDIDSFGILNNAVHLSLIEQARYGYFLELGLLRDDNFPFVLGESKVRYLQPGLAGMVLDVSAQVTRLGTKSLEMDYELRHGHDLLATAQATLIWVDEDLRSCPIPDEARVKMATFEGIAAS